MDRLQLRARSSAARDNRCPRPPAISSTAITPAALRAICAALRAAIGAIDTWSSWPAEVGIESTLAGKARLLFSLTSAAAVTCGIIRPELTPESSVRKAGRPLILGSTRTLTRRSEIEPTSHSAMAIVSAAKATGWAWKLPPEIALSSSGKTIGLSVTAPASMVSVRAALCEQVERGAHHLRLAAEAVGVLHPAALRRGWSRISLPSSRPRDRGGDADLARAGRAAREMRGSNGLARALERIDRQRAGGDRRGEHALAGEQGIERERGRLACVPLISARPSFGPSCKRLAGRAARARRRRGMTSPATSMRP